MSGLYAIAYGLLFLAISIPAQSYSYEWTVENLKGEVLIELDSGQTKVVQAMKLPAGALIITQPRGRVQLKSGTSSLWIGSNSSIKLPLSASALQGERPVLDILKGKIRAKIDSQGKDNAEKFILYRTRQAVAGVRGTEFFISSDHRGDSYCGLENDIEVTPHGASHPIVVPEGKGLVLEVGRSPQLQENSSDFVTQWISETSADTADSFIDSYDQKKFYKTAYGDNLFYGLKAWSLFCHSDGPDTNLTEGRSVAQCSRNYLTPFLQYNLSHGSRNFIFVRPALNIVSSSQNTTIDSIPIKSGRDHIQLSLAEAYLESEFYQGMTGRLGIQEIEWADGVLLGVQRWAPEVFSHMGGVFSMTFNNAQQIKLIATFAQTPSEPLDGKSHIAHQGIQWSPFGRVADFYYLRQDFGQKDNQYGVTQKGHVTDNLGVFSHTRWKNFDYDFSGIYQHHPRHIDSFGSSASVQSEMLDLRIGIFPIQNRNVRASLRYLRAGKNFIAGLEDYYRLGQSGVVKVRGNLEQIRAKIDYQPSTKHFFYFEWIGNKELSARGLIRHTNSLADDDVVFGNEFDLSYIFKVSEKLELFTGLWTFLPSSSSVRDEEAQGLQLKLSYDY